MLVFSCRLQSETDIKVYQQKLREAEKLSDELNAKLAKKEHECETRLAEKVRRHWTVFVFSFFLFYTFKKNH